MNENNINGIEFSQPKMYSKRAIWGFSIAFSPIFAGFLLRQNLLDIDNKKLANQALFYSFLCTLLTFFLSIIFEKYIGKSVPSWPLNIPGGLILSEILYKRYFPIPPSQIKPIWKPLFISLLITLPFIYALVVNSVNK